MIWEQEGFALTAGRKGMPSVWPLVQSFHRTKFEAEAALTNLKPILREHFTLEIVPAKLIYGPELAMLKKGAEG